MQKRDRKFNTLYRPACIWNTLWVDCYVSSEFAACHCHCTEKERNKRLPRQLSYFPIPTYLLLNTGFLSRAMAYKSLSYYLQIQVSLGGLAFLQTGKVMMKSSHVVGPHFPWWNCHKIYFHQKYGKQKRKWIDVSF